MIDLLKAVKKKEVQKQGAKSMTQHLINGKEFQNMHKKFHEANGNGKRTTNACVVVEKVRCKCNG